MDRNLGAQLLHAARYDDGQGVRNLLARGAPIDYRDPETGRTALHIAADGDCVDAARALVDLGASLNIPDSLGWMPLALAVDATVDDALQNDHSLAYEVVRLLVAAGADPTGFKAPGKSAVEVATGYRADAVLALLRPPA